jgi:hypothetical protein
MRGTPNLELAEIATSTGPLGERAQQMLGRLRCLVPFDAAWLALVDPVRGSYTSLASSDLDEATLQFLSGPKMARDIEVTQTDRARPPLSPSDLPYPCADLPTWAECLIPAGFPEALAVGLSTAGSATWDSWPCSSGAGSRPCPGSGAGCTGSPPCWRRGSTRFAR